MFSAQPRCLLRKNQLGDVICQLRFPEILMIGVKPPAEFQEAIRDTFPQYAVRKEAGAPKITGTPGNLSIENSTPTVNYQFASEDGVWRVNLTSTFVSLACSRYTCWEDFAKKLDKPLAAFIQIYKPAYFSRVGLRYLNFISRNSLSLEGTAFTQLIQSAYLGPLEYVPKHTVSRCNVDTEMAIRGGCNAKIHAGPGLIRRNGQQDHEIRFIFDQDLFMQGKIPVNVSTGALETIHAQAYPIFRGAITDMLFEAMEPETI